MVIMSIGESKGENKLKEDEEDEKRIMKIDDENKCHQKKWHEEKSMCLEV